MEVSIENTKWVSDFWEKLNGHWVISEFRDCWVYFSMWNSRLFDDETE
jgi:hypothetical protein